MKYIVVALRDKKDYGFNEETFPPLLDFLSSHPPDHFNQSHTGIIFFYRESESNLITACDLIQKASVFLKDSKFESLGIGVSEGDLICPDNGLPVGETVSEAYKLAMNTDSYKNYLRTNKAVVPTPGS